MAELTATVASGLFDGEDDLVGVMLGEEQLLGGDSVVEWKGGRHPGFSCRPFELLPQGPVVFSFRLFVTFPKELVTAVVPLAGWAGDDLGEAHFVVGAFGPHDVARLFASVGSGTIP
jgi:hypothetical protein